MKVYTLWTQMSQGLNQTQSNAFWQEYFAIETDIYKQLLNKKDPHIQGTLEELAREYEVDNPVFAGFLDGINESILPPIELEDLEETSLIDVKVDYEKLFYNMMEAKADWLYNLPIWKELLDNQKRNELRKTYLAAHTRSVEKVGRNAPCPCGSGKKYKYCCINKQ
ncbi:MAG TPA: SEC-C metal-binding domain-containing protein [Clostridia bacterium]|nr:SEC-C metal-binding domain-containing protein [Clostridia bacterium]